MQFNLQGPFSLLPFKEKSICDIHKPGVYLWCVKYQNQYHVNYVGISNDIGYRQIKHLEYFLTGKYTIYHPSEFTQLKKTEVYSPVVDSFVKNYLQNFNTIKDLLIPFLELFQMFYFEVPNNEHNLKMIETSIIQSLKLSQTNNFLDNRRTEYPTKDNTPFEFEILTSEDIVGIRGITFKYLFNKIV